MYVFRKELKPDDDIVRRLTLAFRSIRFKSGIFQDVAERFVCGSRRCEAACVTEKSVNCIHVLVVRFYLQIFAKMHIERFVKISPRSKTRRREIGYRWYNGGAHGTRCNSRS